MDHSNTYKGEYFEWLYEYGTRGMVSTYISYRKLFELLHSIKFDYYLLDDSNRYADGISLRRKFENAEGFEGFYELCDEPCSVLEMMLALAIRCEDTIMSNHEYGDRTRQWLWGMILNLGIGRMTDDVFDKRRVETCVYRFMEHDYDYDGKGGLFLVRNPDRDMRDLDIWTQMCWYLDNFE